MPRPSFLPDIPLANIAWGLELPLLVLNWFALSTMVVAWFLPGSFAATIMAVAVLAAVAGLGFRKTRADHVDLVGRYVLSRLAVVFTVAWLPSASWMTNEELLAAAILAGCLLTEPVARAFAAQAFPYAANFPGTKTRTVHLPADAIFWTNLGATTALMLLRGPWVRLELVIAAVAALVNLFFMLDMALFTLSRLRFNARLPKLWEEMAPTFAIHWRAGAGSLHQLTMWLDYLKALDKPFFVITRTRENFLEVVRSLDVPVLHRVGLNSVEDALSPSLKTVFYVNTAILNDHMLRYPHLTHIQLNHGDSDKLASYSPVFRSYDKDFVAGQAAIDRFDSAGLATAPGFFVIVGRPQVAEVAPSRGSVSDLKSPTVLYAPTWSGNTQDSNYTSLPKGPKIVQALLDRGCTVVFRPHPYWNKDHHSAAGRQAVVEMLAADAATSGRGHIYGDMAETELSVFDCFNLSDLMISDVSSVVNDYLFSEKPLVMVAVTAPPEMFVEEFPVARGAYVVDFEDVDSTLTQALDAIWNEDPLAATRRELKTYYLGDIPRERYAERFLEEAQKYV